MKRQTILITIALIALVAALSVSNVPASAKPTDTYTVDWYTVDGGGAMFSTGGTYSLGGTIGQADAGTLSGGTYTLNGGFWNVGNLVNLFLPLIKR